MATNRNRINCAIVEVGKKVFRYRINQEIVASDLNGFLNDAVRIKTIEDHLNHEVISPNQYDLLYPSNGQPHLDTLDIGLLMFLIRISDYDSKVWYQQEAPHENDFSLAADVVRIQQLRNGQTQNNEDWRALSKILLKEGVSKMKLNAWRRDIEKIQKNGSITESLTLKELGVWESMDQKLKEKGFDLSPNEGRNRKLKLYTLIIDGSGRMLRGLLELYHPPASWKSTVKNNQILFQDLNNKDIINDSQYKTLSTLGTSPKDFDITLLCVLLRNICRPHLALFWNPVWINEPPLGTSIEEDITRIRIIRNRIQHIPSGAVFTENEFETQWNDLKQILMRLNRNTKWSNLEDDIDKLKEQLVPEDKQEELEAQIKAWIDLDTKYTKELSYLIRHYSPLVDHLSKIDDVIPGLGQLQENSKIALEKVSKDDVFVKTKQFKKAKEKLTKDGIIVIYGSAGEGKSLLAMQLVLELSPKKKFMKLDRPQQWECVTTDIEIVLIDDMFGACVFDKAGSRKWEKYIESIYNRKESQNNPLKIVIVSRAYILEEALDKLILRPLCTEDALFFLRSKDLDEDEKRNILNKHYFRKHNKIVDESLMKEILHTACQHNNAFAIGFPECARLFSCNNELLKENAVFFKQPMYCVKSLFSRLFETDDEVLVAFFVLWAQASQTLSALGLELPLEKTAKTVKDPILKLQCLPEDFMRKIRYVLNKHTHESGLILCDKIREEFSFSHRVVGDAVGLVAYKINPTAVLDTCDAEFIKQFLCIENHADDKNEKVVVSPARFSQLSDRICVLFETSPPVSAFLFTLPFFENEQFCEEFMKTAKTRQILEPLLTTPIQTVFAEFSEKTPFLKFDKEMCLPSFLIFSQHKISYFCQSCLQELETVNEVCHSKEIKLSMILGVKKGWSNVVENLINIGGVVNINMVSVALLNDEIDEEMARILQIDKNRHTLLYEVCQKGYRDVLCKLVKSDNWQYIYENVKAGESPIQRAAKNKHTDIVNELLDISREAGESDDFQKEKKRKVLVWMFYEAAANGNRKMMNLLKSEIPKTDSDNEVIRALFQAFKNKRNKVSKKLVDWAIYENIPVQSEIDSENNTLLILALKNYADRLQKGKEGTNSDINPWLEISKQICKLEQDINHKNDEGEKAITLACRYELVEIVNAIIVSLGTSESDAGNLILHQFVEDEEIECISTILQSQLNPNLSDKRYRTPLMLAKELGNEKVVEKLMSDERISEYDRKFNKIMSTRKRDKPVLMKSLSN